MPLTLNLNLKALDPRGADLLALAMRLIYQREEVFQVRQGLEVSLSHAGVRTVAAGGCVEDAWSAQLVQWGTTSHT